MKTTQKLHEIGQSLWLDNITRGLLASGTLQRYIRGVIDHGSYLEPHDLRSRHQEQSRL